MVSCRLGVGVTTLVAAACLTSMPLAALSMRECSAAFRSAQKSGTLGGMGWQEFRKARCGAAATGATPGARPGAGPSPGSAAGVPAGGSAYLPGGRAVFPTGVAPRYADETPGKGRRQTCLDQYRVNKASNANGGLKWVQKGGGYYSECNKRLKGAKP